MGTGYTPVADGCLPRWRLLGPVRLDGLGRHDDGTDDLRPGAGKQRTLLAVLLLAPGQVVPVETLIERVWGEQPPSGRNPVAPYITRLRRIIVAAAPDGELGVLRHSHGGYRLDCDPDRIDLHRARRIAGEVPDRWDWSISRRPGGVVVYADARTDATASGTGQPADRPATASRQ